MRLPSSKGERNSTLRGLESATFDMRLSCCLSTLDLKGPLGPSFAGLRCAR